MARIQQVTRPGAGLRGPGPLLAVVACLLGSVALAQTYDVKVEPELNGLDVKIEPVAMTDMLVIKLTNQTTQKVRCNLRYDASPQALYRKTTYIDPGKTEQSEFRAKRKWFEVQVKVECQPSGK